MTLKLVLSSAVVLLLTINHVCAQAVDGCEYSDGTVVSDKQFIWVDRYQICQCEVDNDNQFQCVTLAPNIPEVREAVNFEQCNNCPKVITILKAKREVTRAMEKLTRIEDDSNMAPYQTNITSLIASLGVSRNDYKRQIRDQRRLEQKGIRLVDGLTAREGRMEMFYNGTWATVCDFMFGRAEVAVACRHLGFTDGTPSFTENPDFRVKEELWDYEPILSHHFQCEGTEATLFDCETRPMSEWGCGHHQDVSLYC